MWETIYLFIHKIWLIKPNKEKFKINYVCLVQNVESFLLFFFNLEKHGGDVGFNLTYTKL